MLTFDEVNTFLHEFGHALHGMFANTKYQSLSGTSVYRDFVELPSQIMENFTNEREFLSTFATHYKTGELMPDNLIEGIKKSQNYLAAYACIRQVSFGMIDMAYYTQTQEFKAHIPTFEKKIWQPIKLLPTLPETCMTTSFGHIMSGGYAAGYYSYKWAEVLDADAFSVFQEHGIFDRTTAKSFRENILSRGGTEDPMTLYKRFRTQEPNIKALMIRDGVIKK